MSLTITTITPPELRWADTAIALADRLCADAVWDGDHAWWSAELNVPVNGGVRRRRRPVSGDVYAGTAGIGMFLARVWTITGDDPTRATALGAFEHSLRWATGSEPAFVHNSLSGSVGAAMVCADGAATLGQSELSDRARRAAGMLLDTPRDDAPLDYLHGIAGLLPALLDCDLPNARSAADGIARTLVDSSRDRGDGAVSWASHSPFAYLDRDELTGFSHGASGIAYALLRYGNATGDDDAVATAESALRYERRFFAEAEGNWQDLRFTPTASGLEPEHADYPIMWCHGAVGIAITRVLASRVTGSSTWLAEARTALATVHADAALDRIAVSGDTLCHGLAGEIECLLDGRSVEPACATDAFIGTTLDRLCDAVIDRCRSSPLPEPGLVNGVTGAGDVLLRASGRWQLPSLLIERSGIATT